MEVEVYVTLIVSEMKFLPHFKRTKTNRLMFCKELNTEDTSYTCDVTRCLQGQALIIA